jgi:hypothetical protein
VLKTYLNNSSFEYLHYKNLLFVKEKIKVIVTAAPGQRNIIPSGFYMEQNNPNPFEKLTTIKFCLPCQSKVTVIITNEYGKVVDKLISCTQKAGTYELKFLADGLPEGTYYFHVVADNYSESQEMELIK